DGGAGVFEGAIVGDVTGEDGGIEGDADLVATLIGHVSVDGAGAAAEGHRAVVDEAAGAEDAVAGNLAGVVERRKVGVESSAGEADNAAVGAHAAEEKFVPARGGDGAGVGDTAGENE